MRNLEGQRFGRLIALRHSGRWQRRGKKEWFWLCRCACGKQVRLQTSRLTTGSTNSCGCLKIESNKFHSVTHGMTGSPEWLAWMRIKARCYNKNHDKYRYYGQRGIKVAASFRKSFTAFYKEIGSRPSVRHSVERVDNSRGYEPGNVKWATMSEQRRNRRDSLRLITVGGVTRCLTDWQKMSGLNYETIRYRLKSGWNAKDAIFTASGRIPR